MKTSGYSSAHSAFFIIIVYLIIFWLFILCFLFFWYFCLNQVMINYFVCKLYELDYGAQYFILSSWLLIHVFYNRFWVMQSNLGISVLSDFCMLSLFLPCNSEIDFLFLFLFLFSTYLCNFQVNKWQVSIFPRHLAGLFAILLARLMPSLLK